jgi:hypothetical protein
LNGREALAIVLDLASMLVRSAAFLPFRSAPLQHGTLQMADRLSDACRRGRRAYRQGIRASENPYGCSDDLALAWEMGWQCEQDFDELSGYINSKSYKPLIEPDSEASEELWNLIKSQL